MKKSKRNFTEKSIPEGITAWYHHIRDKNRVIFETTCDLIDSVSGETLVTGHARVSPRDNPSKKIGRAISLGRALKLYHLGN